MNKRDYAESHNQKVPSVPQHYLTFLTICFGRSSCLFQYVVQVLHFLYGSAEIASLFSWMLARPVILFWHVSYIPEHSNNPRTKSLEQISVRNLWTGKVVNFPRPNCTVYYQNFTLVNRIWPTAVEGEADSVSSVSASACHIGGPNYVNPGQIM